MENVLKKGDLVKYHSPNDYLDKIGFTIGSFYEIIEYPDGGLLVKAAIALFDLPLFLGDGEPTIFADNFTKHVCPVNLPKGNA